MSSNLHQSATGRAHQLRSHPLPLRTLPKHRSRLHLSQLAAPRRPARLRKRRQISQPLWSFRRPAPPRSPVSVRVGGGGGADRGREREGERKRKRERDTSSAWTSHQARVFDTCPQISTDTLTRRVVFSPPLFFFLPQAGGGYAGSLLRGMASVARGAALWLRVLQAACRPRCLFSIRPLP